MDKVVFSAASQGHTVLTVNDRLARHLVSQYDQAQQKSGRTAWLRPEIMSLSAWLARQTDRLPQALTLLSKSQNLRLWEIVIERDLKQAGEVLLQVPQTAQRACQAQQLLTQYSADFTVSQASEDHRVFLRWREQWQQQMKLCFWHDNAERPRIIAEAIAAGDLLAPKQVILAGFDDMIPDLKQLSQVLSQAGTTVTDWHPPAIAEVERYRVAANDPADEVRQCAFWVRGVLEKKPNANIGIVVPQLEQYQKLLENIFPAELDPAGVLAGEDHSSLFNLSLGRRLDQEGVISAALCLLRLNSVLSMDQLSRLLRSPYLGRANAERDARAQLDQVLRRSGRIEWPLHRLLRVLEQTGKKYHHEPLQFIALLAKLQDDLRCREKLMPGGWAERFTSLLRQLGWPGDRTLSSREYQAVQQLKRAFAELAGLDMVSAPVTRAEAVKLLCRLAANAEFQTEGSDCSIQVLGELEASGLVFDHLWILGLHDAALPRPPSPNPFIPLSLQRQFGMKRATADRERHFAAQVSERLFSAAPEVVVSWPKQVDGNEHRPSPFIAEIAERCLPSAISLAPAFQLCSAQPGLEIITDDLVRPLTSKKSFTGGTGIIKDQALCPFSAFAHHRLRARELDVPEIGVDNMSRGTLVHSLLEIFWADVADQETLLGMDESTLLLRLEDAVEQALRRLEKEQRQDLPVCQRRLEARRLVRVGRQWLELEKQRPPFQVKAAEESRLISVGKLTIRTRIDRIDSLENGQVAIIDYKTGKPDPGQWLNERITEPQLPIYCLGLSKEEIGAVMFAAVRSKAKESGFLGLSREHDAWTGTSGKKISALMEEKGLGDFDAVLQHWEEALSRLGDDFAAGNAAVDPVDPELSCRYCELTSFCRIHEVKTVLYPQENADA